MAIFIFQNYLVNNMIQFYYLLLLISQNNLTLVDLDFIISDFIFNLIYFGSFTTYLVLLHTQILLLLNPLLFDHFFHNFQILILMVTLNLWYLTYSFQLIKPGVLDILEPLITSCFIVQLQYFLFKLFYFGIDFLLQIEFLVLVVNSLHDLLLNTFQLQS